MYEIIKKLCKEKGISINALESKLNFAKGSLCKIDKTKPSAEKLQKLATFFDVSIDYLSGESEYRNIKEMLSHLDKSDLQELLDQVHNCEIGDIEIPVLEEITAGVPIFTSENYVGYECISKDIAKKGSFFGLTIKGDSMSPRICDGDVVIVKQQDYADSGDIVIVLINGDSATCKRLMKYENGISLISFNPIYVPIHYSDNDITQLPIKIIGKVVENRQKY